MFHSTLNFPFSDIVSAIATGYSNMSRAMQLLEGQRKVRRASPCL